MRSKLTIILLVAITSTLFMGPIGRTQTIDPAQCAAETTAPEAVQIALDELLASFVDANNPAVATFGLAPGAVFLIDAPDWRY